MTIAEMMGQSGVITLLGMTVVFTFISMMVGAITVVCKLISGRSKSKDEIINSASVDSAGGSEGITAAISAAVYKYREK